MLERRSSPEEDAWKCAGVRPAGFRSVKTVVGPVGTSPGKFQLTLMIASCVCEERCGGDAGKMQRRAAFHAAHRLPVGGYMAVTRRLHGGYTAHRLPIGARKGVGLEE